MSACITHTTCDNKDLSWTQLAKLLGTVTGAGCPALRTIDSTNAAEEAWEWDDFTNLEWDDNSIIGID